MRVLVTGGAGFIGSAYTKMILGANTIDEKKVTLVTVVDKLTYAGNILNLKAVEQDPRFRFVLGDITDPKLMSELIPEHDLVVNFAAESHVDRSISNPQEFILTNILGVQTILSSLLSSRSTRFVQVSTDEVYGSIENGSWDENYPLLPNSPYAASKASADLLIRSFVRTFGIDARITRCSNNYGPFQHPEKLIPRAITNILNGKKICIYGDGLNIREWIHVQDHCEAIHQVALNGAPGEIYNIPGGVEKTNLEVAYMLLDALGSSVENLEFVEDRKGHDLRYAIDGDKYLSNFKTRKMRDFNSGLIETVNWYKDNRSWWDLVSLE